MKNLLELAFFVNAYRRVLYKGNGQGESDELWFFIYTRLFTMLISETGKKCGRARSYLLSLGIARCAQELLAL